MNVSDWLRKRYTFFSWDFGLGVLFGISSSAVLALNEGLRRDPDTRTILFVEASLSVAVLAVVLTALAILVAFLGDTYVKLLRESVGIKAAFRPYKTVSRVSAAASIVAVVSAFLWPELVSWARIILFGSASGLAAWAVAGTVQLVTITIGHGERRARMPEIKEAAQTALEERRKRREAKA